MGDKHFCHQREKKWHERAKEKMKKGNLFFITVLLICPRAYSAASCDDGYSIVSNVNSATFMSPVGEICQFGGYSLITLPDDFDFIFNGTTFGSVETLCSDGHLTSGSCVPYQEGTCKSGYDVAVNSSTFMLPVGDICQTGGYSLTTISDDFTMIGNGMLLGGEEKLCTNGYLSGGTCIEYTAGDCMSGYYDLAINANTVAELTNGTCTSPYSKFTGTTRCDRNPGGTCVDLPTPEITYSWDAGNGTTGTDTCFYEEDIVLPQAPEKTGYTFVGWALKTE